MFFLIEIFCIIFHAIAGHYDSKTDDMFRYSLWQDVNVMIFIGFGFLMTFLRRFSFGAVAFTILIGGMAFQIYPIWEMFWECIWDPNLPFQMHMNPKRLILSSFCAGSVLIAYGGVIGTISHF